ncbi:MAG: nucleotidyltransferase family protein [Cohaesibacteraceae bacterium]|nr:nucleotidyltransferase family protein [Cohaesibacteraceae bacterium]
MVAIENICVSKDTPLKELIGILNEQQAHIVLIVDGDKRLTGCFTDGDLLRAIRSGMDLDHPIDGHFNASPISISQNESPSAVLQRMQHKSINQLPVIDENGKVVGLESRKSLKPGIGIPNQVIIMAGGLGSRLRPLTDTMPKALVPVGDRPVLQVILERFIAQGFINFTFAVNHMAGMIEDHFGNGDYWNVHIDYLRETKPLGTAGALSLLKNSPEHPVLVTNCDVLTEARYKDIIEQHQRNSPSATIAVREHSYQVPYGVLQTDGNALCELVEKPLCHWNINAGIYVLSPQAFDLIPVNKFYDITELIQTLLEQKKRVETFIISKYWIDIGMPDDLERARQAI